MMDIFFSTEPLFGQSLPHPNQVVMVIEENRSYSDVIGNTNAPYITALASQGAAFTSSHNIWFPSQPNYLALFAGFTDGVAGDYCPLDFFGPNLASELIAAGLTFGGYSEDLPFVGDTNCGFGLYERKHNPWADFPDLPPTVNLPFTYFPSNFTQLPTVSIIVPDEVHNMHSGSTSAGDAWLEQNLDSYIRWARTNNSLFILTFDEPLAGGPNIPTFFFGPMVRPGIYTEFINHYTVLRTIEDLYGLPYLGQSSNPPPITSIWQPISLPPIEIWRSSKFTTRELAVSAITGDGADPDHDGIPNIYEYVFGLEPKGANNHTGLPFGRIENGYLTLTYNHLKATTDVLLFAEVSPDLLTWDAGPNYVEQIRLVDNSASEAITVRSRTSVAAASQSFMRLRAQQQ